MVMAATKFGMLTLCCTVVIVARADGLANVVSHKLLKILCMFMMEILPSNSHKSVFEISQAVSLDEDVTQEE